MGGGGKVWVGKESGEVGEEMRVGAVLCSGEVGSVIRIGWGSGEEKRNKRVGCGEEKRNKRVGKGRKEKRNKRVGLERKEK